MQTGIARSPPLFIQMLARYVAASNDTAILTCVLPLAELHFLPSPLSLLFRVSDIIFPSTSSQTTVSVKSPIPKKMYAMAQYSVTTGNTAPRPELYLQVRVFVSFPLALPLFPPSFLSHYSLHYLTIHDPTQPTLNASQSTVLYPELASGAETGWDYSSRWITNPTVPNPNVGVGSGPWQAGLQALNVKGTIPVTVGRTECLAATPIYRARSPLRAPRGPAGHARGRDAHAGHQRLRQLSKGWINGMVVNGRNATAAGVGAREALQMPRLAPDQQLPLVEPLNPNITYVSIGTKLKTGEELKLFWTADRGVIFALLPSDTLLGSASTIQSAFISAKAVADTKATAVLHAATCGDLQLHPATYVYTGPVASLIYVRLPSIYMP
ncbi:hypothetical protein C8R44DRAFT_990844 [Mycena epipterygia]|nr:hypothetical protein C8R44DRAFT_990844 [Mycena epipterygia]